MAEKERLHSQDVTGKVPKILKQIFIFSKATKSTAFNVAVTEFGREPLKSTQYFSTILSLLPGLEDLINLHKMK